MRVTNNGVSGLWVRSLLVCMVFLVIGTVFAVSPVLSGAHAVAAVKDPGSEVSAAVPGDYFTEFSRPAARTNVEDFSFSRVHVEYALGLDRENRAVAAVRETLTAVFPEHDQNRGIVRGIPERYLGVDVALANIRVKDVQGTPIPYTSAHESGMLMLALDDDTYKHGEHTYVIEYTMKDIIGPVDARATGQQLQDGAKPADEFYWNLFSLQHAQPIDSFTATIRVADEKLYAAYLGKWRCYAGAQGETGACGNARQEGETFTVTQTALNEDETVTIAIGFQAGTVRQPSARIFEPVLRVLSLTFTLLAFAVSVIGLIIFYRGKKRITPSGRGTVIARYEPPQGLQPLVAGELLAEQKNSLPAQIMQYVVGGALRVEERAGGGAATVSGAGGVELWLRLVNPGRICFDKIAKHIFKAFFAGDTTFTSGNPLVPGLLSGDGLSGASDVGSREGDESFTGVEYRGDLSRLDSEAGKDSRRDKQLLKALEAGHKAFEAAGYTQRLHVKSAKRFSLIVTLPAVILAVIMYFSYSAFYEAEDVGLVFFLLGTMSILFFVKAVVRAVLPTEQGALVKEHLQGLRLFIRVAEAERLRYLQSYSGAERLSDGSVNVVAVYEKLLPFAILFGLEREWGDVLSKAYSLYRTNPDWITDGDGRFTNAMVSGSVVRSLGGYSASLASVQVRAASSGRGSGSSGGFSGGGSSGGGGGGGFSGGR